MNRYYIFIVSFLINTLNMITNEGVVQAQVSCQSLITTSNMIRVEDLWAASIDNQTLNPLNVSLRFQFLKNDSVFIESSSQTVLSAGINQLSGSALKNQEYFIQPYAQSPTNQKDFITVPGTYMLCFQITDLMNDEIINSSCQEISILGNSSDNPERGSKKSLGYHGTASLDGGATNNPYMQYDGAPMYVNIYSTSELKYKRIPLDFTVNYSTNQKQNASVFDYVSFEFDSQKYLDLLKKAALEKIAEKTSSIKDVEGVKNTAVKELDKVNLALQNPSIQGQLKQLSELKQIEGLLGNSTKKIDTLSKGTNLSSLGSQVNQISQINDIEDLKRSTGVLDTINNVAKIQSPQFQDKQPFELSSINRVKSKFNKSHAAPIEKTDTSSFQHNVPRTTEPKGIDGFKSKSYKKASVNSHKSPQLSHNNVQQLADLNGIDGAKNKVMGGLDTNSAVNKAKNLQDKANQLDKDSLRRFSNDKLDTLNTVAQNPTVKRLTKTLSGSQDINGVLGDESAMLEGKAKDSLNGLLGKYGSIAAKRVGLEKLLKKKEDLSTKVSYCQGKLSQLNAIKNGDLSDLKVLETKLRSFGLWRKVDKVLTVVKKIGLGHDNLYYSDFTLKNIPFTGINFEITPGKFYVAGAWGNIQKQTISRDYQIILDRKSTIAGGVGYGDRESSHLFFYYVNSKNNVDSISGESAERNKNVISASGSVFSFSDNLHLGGELAVSWQRKESGSIGENVLFIDSSSNQTGTDHLLGFLRQNLDRNNQTILDYAYKVFLQADFFKKTTNLSFSNMHIGSSFESAGAPFALRGSDSYELKLGQKLLKNQLFLGASLRYYKNSYLQGTSNGSFSRNMGFEVRANFRKLPALTVRYMPWMQQYFDRVIMYDMLTANLTYRYKYRKWSFISSANYMMQKSENQFPDSVFGSFNTQTLSASQNFLPCKAINIGLMYSQSQIHMQDSSTLINTLGGSMSIVFFKKVTLSINGGLLMSEHKYDYNVFSQLSFPIVKSMILSIKGERRSALRSFVVAEDIPVKGNIYWLGVSLNMKW